MLVIHFSTSNMIEHLICGSSSRLFLHLNLTFRTHVDSDIKRPVNFGAGKNQFTVPGKFI